MKLEFKADINPSFTKPFGTHTFYQGGLAGPSCHLKKHYLHELEIL